MSGDAGAVDAQLGKLFAHFDLSDDGSLWAVIVPTLGAQERVAHRIVDRLVEAGRAVERFRFRGDALSLATWLRALPEGSSGVLLVLDLDALPEAERRRAIALLNRGREALGERHWDVVLFITPTTERAIARDAGDFWSWRRGVTDLSAMEAGEDFAAEHARLRSEYLREMLERTEDYKVPRVLAWATYGSGRPELHFDDCYLPPRSLPDLDGDGWGTTEDVLDAHGRVVVSVERGFGGTQFLTWVLRRSIQRARAGAASAKTPVRLTCARLLAAMGGRPRGDLINAIAPLFSRDAMREFAAPVVAAIERGQALLLINDLDDLSDRQERARVARWVDETLVANPGNHVCVTASPAAWRGTAFTEGYRHVRLPRLSLADAAALVTRIIGGPMGRVLFDMEKDPWLRECITRPFYALLYALNGLGRRRRSRFDVLAETWRSMTEAARRELGLSPRTFGVLARCLLTSGGEVSQAGLASALAGVVGDSEEAIDIAAWLLSDSTFGVEVERGAWTLRPEYQDALLVAAATGELAGVAEPEALVRDRHRRHLARVAVEVWEARGAVLRGALADSPPAPYEDILLRDLLLRGSAGEVAALCDALRARWPLRVPSLAARITRRLLRVGRGGLEREPATANAAIAALHCDDDHRLALDALSFRLLTARENPLSALDLARICWNLDSPRFTVATRAWQCVALLANDLTVLDDLPSPERGAATATLDDLPAMPRDAFGVARRALVAAAARSLTTRSSATVGDRAWELGLSWCRRGLTAGDGRVRVAALRGLACDPASSPPEGWHRDPDPAVRVCVLRAWGRRLPLGSRLALVRDPVEAVRGAVAHALGGEHGETVADGLRALSRDPDGHVRAAAVGALRGADTALALDALNDEDCDVRAAAAETLRPRGHDELHATLRAHGDRAGWDAVQRALAGASVGLRYDDVIEGLRQVLAPGGAPRDAATLARVVAVAARTLPEPPGEGVVRPLLEHPDARVREAAWGMARDLVEAPACCAALLESGLRDVDPRVRVAAARAVPAACRADPARCAARWCALLDDPDAAVASAAAQLLRETGASRDWAGEPRARACDALAARLRGDAATDARDEALTALFWETLDELAAAQSDEAPTD